MALSGHGEPNDSPFFSLGNLDDLMSNENPSVLVGFWIIVPSCCLQHLGFCFVSNMMF